MSLRWRLALVVGAVAALAIALASTASYLSTRAELNSATDDFLRGRAIEFADAVRPSGDRGDRGRRPGPPRGFDEPDAVTQVIDAEGNVLLASDPELPVDDVAREAAASFGSGRSSLKNAPIERVEVDGTPIAVIVAPLPTGGAVQIGRDLSETDQVLGALRNRLVVIGFAGTAAAALLAWGIAVGISRPLRRVSGAAETVAATQALDTRIEVGRRDEVGRLAESFNTMLEALEASRQQQRQLVADASHELRTPLTSLRTNIEMLDRVDDLDPADRRRLLADVTFELEELSELVDEVVQSASAVDPGTMTVQEVEVDRLVRRVAERAERRSGRTLAIQAEPAIVDGSADLLERAVGNLVGNAVKFSPDDTPIEVRVRAGDEVEVEVRDHGPGVPAEELDAIFDRFHRTAGARDAPGSGLGLAIVRQIATAHDGWVDATAAPGGGLAVTLRLPSSGGRA